MTSSRPFDYPASGRVRTASLYRAPGRGSSVPALVVVHGLMVDRRLAEIEIFCDALSGDFDVVAIDLRGHGDAPGPFTWGREEPRDLGELVGFLRTLYPAVGVAGFSIGGAIAVISAAGVPGQEHEARPDALCTIGTPDRIEPWRLRFSLLGFLAHFRMIARRRRRWIRPGWPSFRHVRTSETVPRVAPIPLLVAHGGADWLVHPSHARRIHQAARGFGELLILEGGGHAEYLLSKRPERLVAPVREFFRKRLDQAR